MIPENPQIDLSLNDPRAVEQERVQREADRVAREDQFARENMFGTQIMNAFLDPDLDIGLDEDNEQALRSFISENVENEFVGDVISGVATFGGELGAGLLDVMSAGIKGGAGEIAAQMREFGIISGDREFDDAVADLTLMADMAGLLLGTRPGTSVQRAATKREIRAQTPPSAPSGLSLKNRSSAIFDQVSDLPVVVQSPMQTMGGMVRAGNNALPRMVTDAVPIAQRHINRMRNTMTSGQPISVGQLITLRKDLTRDIFSLSGQGSRQVRNDLIPLVNEFDSFAFSPSALTSTSADVAGDLSRARELYFRAMKTMDIEEAVSRGISGQGMTIPQQFRTLVDIDQAARIRGFAPRFTDPELQLMLDISRGGDWTSRLLNNLGQFGKMSIASGNITSPKVLFGQLSRAGRAGSIEGQAATLRNLVASGSEIPINVTRPSMDPILAALLGASGFENR
jgi:hypothetical protein